MFKKLKTLKGYTADARWFAEIDEKPVGEIERVISQAYTYSPTHVVWKWNEKNVIHIESRHRTYDIYEIPNDIKIMPYQD